MTEPKDELRPFVFDVASFGECAELGLADEDAIIGSLVVLLLGARKFGLDVERNRLDLPADVTVVALGEGADGRHCRVPFSFRAAPIAASMAGDRPEAVDPHPEGAGTQ